MGPDTRWGQKEKEKNKLKVMKSIRIKLKEENINGCMGIKAKDI